MNLRLPTTLVTAVLAAGLLIAAPAPATATTTLSEHSPSATAPPDDPTLTDPPPAEVPAEPTPTPEPEPTEEPEPVVVPAITSLSAPSSVSSPQITVSAGISGASGLTAQLQLQDKTSWTKVAESSRYATNDPATAVLKYTFSGPATGSFRVVLTDGTTTAATSRQVVIKYSKPYVAGSIKMTASAPGIDKTGLVKFTMKATGTKDRKVVLSKWNGKSWAAVWTSGTFTGTSGTVTASYKFPRSERGTFSAALVEGNTTHASSGLVRVNYRSLADRRPVASVKSNVKSTYQQSIKVRINVKDGYAGKAVLQRWTGKKWVNVWTSGTLNSDSTNVYAPWKYPKEQSVRFRGVVTVNGKTKSVSPSFVIKYAKKATNIYPQYSGQQLFGYKKGKVASYEQAADKWFLYPTISTRTGSLQELRKGKWVIVQKLTWKKNPKATWMPAYQTVKTPKTSKTVKKRYRLVVNATPHEKGWSSKSVTISHENPRHYTGYKKQAYNYMKKYCPNQIILTRPGLRSLAWSHSHRIEMGYYTNQKTLKAIALHECAHIITFKLYKNDWGAMQKLNKIYGASNGIEQVADCMAFRMGASKNAGVLWYNKDCSGYKGTAAKKILQGKRP